MSTIKYRLICGLLATSLLANACSSLHSSSTFTLDLNDFPETPKHASNTPAPSKTDTRTQTHTAPSYTPLSYSPSSYPSSPSDSKSSLAKVIGTLLGFVFAWAVADTVSGSGGGYSAYDSDWTDIEKKVGHRMTKSEYKEYYENHPEMWDTVYVVPKK